MLIKIWTFFQIFVIHIFFGQILWSSSFGTKFVQKKIWKVLKKFCTPVPNFSQFAELAQKTLSGGVLGQTQRNLRIKQLINLMLSKKYYNMAGFKWFQVVSGWFQVSGDFRSFLVFVITMFLWFFCSVDALKLWSTYYNYN